MVKEDWGVFSPGPVVFNIGYNECGCYDDERPDL